MGRFASPVTRMLLASEGLTTTLLQAAVGRPLTARVYRLGALTGAEVSAAARFLLGAAVGDGFWVRQSLLVLPSGEAVSDNTVVLRLGVDRRVDAVVADRSRPIGFALGDAGLVGERRVLSVGTTRWPGPPVAVPVCASKTYVLTAADAGVPVLCVQERFHPAYVPPTQSRSCGLRVGRGNPLMLLQEAKRPPPAPR